MSKSSRYTPLQKDLIRQSLRDYRLSGADSSENKPFSWATISDAMFDELGERVTGQNLSRFVDGSSHRNKELRVMGVREYMALADDAIDDIVKFLTDEDCSGYGFLLEEELDHEKKIQRWPSELSHYLSPFILPKSTSIVDQLKNKAFSKDGEKENIDIVISNALEGRAIQFTVRHYKAFDSDYSNLVRGWLILTANDHALLLGQSVRREENKVFSTVSLSGKNLSLLELVSYDGSDPSETLKGMSNQLHVFHKKDID